MSTTLRIADVSRRSGFAPPTLRYYEQLGLLPPADRTPAGYRTYDETVLTRLAFIGRAKRLGCSLEEIGRLMPAWDAGACGPVQDGLRALAAAKLGDAQARTVELVALATDLQRVVATVGTHTPDGLRGPNAVDGACDDACRCVRDAAPAPVIACSLDPAEMPGRLRDWHGLLAYVTRRTAVDGGIRLELSDATPLDDLVRLAAAEQSCCAFFAFVITVDGRGLGLEVRAPAEALAIVTSMFGAVAETG